MAAPPQIWVQVSVGNLINNNKKGGINGPDFLSRKYWHDVSKIEHFALVFRKKYQEIGRRKKCPECTADLWSADADWEYCPYCGADLPNDICISADTDKDVVREYKADTGEEMPPEKQDLIQSAFYVKIWVRK